MDFTKKRVSLIDNKKAEESRAKLQKRARKSGDDGAEFSPNPCVPFRLKDLPERVISERTKNGENHLKMLFP